MSTFIQVLTILVFLCRVNFAEELLNSIDSVDVFRVIEETENRRKEESIELDTSSFQVKDMYEVQSSKPNSEDSLLNIHKSTMSAEDALLSQTSPYGSGVPREAFLDFTVRPSLQRPAPFETEASAFDPLPKGWGRVPGSGF